MAYPNWPLLEADNLSVTFPVSGGFWREKKVVHAVNQVTVRIYPGETLGLVGESGSGKSTLGRALLQLERVAAGEARFDGQRITHGLTSDIVRLRQQSAMIFQDPFASLNPRQTVGESIAEVLRVHQKIPRAQIAQRVAELLTQVGLRTQQASAKPSQLSGGQCQRAGIARALAIEPRLIVADECVAALDVSIQGQIVNLLMDLREKMGLAILFIAHDLAIVRRLCDRVAVMYLGRIVEEGPTETVFTRPLHPYTAALVSAIPEIDPDKPLPKNLLGGEPPSPVAVPSGCAFHPRCPHAQVQCRTGEPPPTRQIADHAYACVLNHEGDETVLSFDRGIY
ncbi:TPA: ABC transporter ATP-binding protein [Klebsiella variicola]|nr:ABC transporter ATP-binding protein [Klebsiella variicola]NSM88043.1 ABC transporter ATP-binding protein [Klebsiella variicola]SLO22812.1 Oligopeptide transport ATP-binding protein OppF [Klebsiella variicola]SXF79140.1 Oligopeptide transport ATP-binding protein OppF [Klebsiella variicola]HBS5981205.1 ABC transporter ATP-binding protein [Klebsiella variicola]